MPGLGLRRRGVVLVLAVAAVGAPVVLSGASGIPAEAYGFARLVDVPVTGNQQGLAYADGVHYVGFDADGTHGQVLGYDAGGRKVRDSGLLPLGHVAEVSFRQADGNLYVATGGGSSPTHVNVVDMRPATPAVLRTYDFAALGPNGLVSIDNERDRMLVFTGRDTAGRWVFTWSDFRGRTTRAFTLTDAGVPQGLEVVDDAILYYTSTWTASGDWANSILVLSLTGTPVRRIAVPGPYEGEGLSADLTTNQVQVGFGLTNRVDRMTPVLKAPLGINLLANPNAESGTAARSPAVARPLPSWTARGMTALSYATGGRHPGARSPGPPARGSLMFAGGTAARGRMAQVLRLTGLSTADVDAGRIRVDLRGWLGGYRDQEDRAEVVATFLDRTGGRTGSARIGPVTAADRAGVTGLLKRSTTATLAPGTRSVRVEVIGTRSAGSTLDAYADALSVRLYRQ